MDFLTVVMKLVSVGATLLFLAGVVLMLLTFRRARTLKTSSLVIPMAVSLLVLFLYGVFLGATPSMGWLLLGLVVGGLLGALWARTHRLFVAGGHVRSQANLWFLAIWALVLSLNQLVLLVSNRSSRVLVALLVVSTGVALGNGLVLLARFRRMRATVQG